MEEKKEKQSELKVDDLLDIINHRNQEKKQKSKCCYIEDPDDLTLRFHQLQRMVQNRNKELKKQDFIHQLQEENKLLQQELEKNQGELDECYDYHKQGFRMSVRFLIIYCLVAGLGITGIGKYKKYQEEKKVAPLEKQLDAEIEDFDLSKILGKVTEEEVFSAPLGSLLESYLGIDLEDEKVEKLDNIGGLIAFDKYRLDTGDSLDYSISAGRIYSYIDDVIYYDNPELAHYQINIEDGYLYANGKYKIVDPLLRQYFLTIDYIKSMYDDASLWEDTKEELDLMIDTCLKVTCYDVLLDSEEAELDLSLSRLARENDYQFPPAINSSHEVCDAVKIKTMKRTSS